MGEKGVVRSSFPLAFVIEEAGKKEERWQLTVRETHLAHHLGTRRDWASLGHLHHASLGALRHSMPCSPPKVHLT